MNLYDLTKYVNLDVDDSFTNEEVAQWYNRGISQYNLIPPLTTYNSIDLETLDINVEIDADLPNTFFLGIIVPFIVAMIKGQESSLNERQISLQEFVGNARNYKSAVNIPSAKLLNQQNTDIDVYQIGENVYLSDMRRSPFQGDWSAEKVFAEIVTDEDDE